MALFVKETASGCIKSKLMGETWWAGVFGEPGVRRGLQGLPDVNVLKIGGQSIADMGARAVLPVMKEIGENARRHKMIISTGGGTRSARLRYSYGAGHAYRYNF